MKNLLKQYNISVGNATKTVFNNDNDIYQDGTLPLYRDKDGTLWAISGHTHAGHIGMFKGTCISDLTEVYPTKMNFETGSADNAFNGIKYPEGIKSRGSVWPMVYIFARILTVFSVFFTTKPVGTVKARVMTLTVYAINLTGIPIFVI